MSRRPADRIQYVVSSNARDFVEYWSTIYGYPIRVDGLADDEAALERRAADNISLRRRFAELFMRRADGRADLRELGRRLAANVAEPLEVARRLQLEAAAAKAKRIVETFAPLVIHHRDPLATACVKAELDSELAPEHVPDAAPMHAPELGWQEWLPLYTAVRLQRLRHLDSSAAAQFAGRIAVFQDAVTKDAALIKEQNIACLARVLAGRELVRQGQATLDEFTELTELTELTRSNMLVASCAYMLDFTRDVTETQIRHSTNHSSPSFSGDLFDMAIPTSELCARAGLS